MRQEAQGAAKRAPLKGPRAFATFLLVGLLLTVVAVAAARPVTVTAGNLVLRLESEVTPSALPKAKLGPIAFRLKAEISTKDRRHPPAARRFESEMDKNAVLNPRGFPVCPQGRLMARTSADALRVCGPALIGRGTVEAEVAFPDQAPFDATGPLLLFNGGGGARRAVILAHLYANVPAPTAILARAVATRIRRGAYGLKIDAAIPAIAGGAGSLTGFELSNQRVSARAGKRQSYFLARCPAGRLLGLSKVHFADGRQLRGSIAVPCVPR